jgi:predicted RNA-binding protein YlqC (UPF0109 family)
MRYAFRQQERVEMSEQVSQSPATDLEELVRYMATNLVEEPDDVTVAAEQRGSSVQINLRVSAKELGKVIGREGRIARSMRTIVMVAGSRNNVRANLDIDGNA